eukprot:397099-Prorocentrum_minimum.AAC.4
MPFEDILSALRRRLGKGLTVRGRDCVYGANAGGTTLNTARLTQACQLAAAGAVLVRKSFLIVRWSSNTDQCVWYLIQRVHASIPFKAHAAFRCWTSEQDESLNEVQQLQKCLVQCLNAPVSDASSLEAKEKSMQLLATLALQQQNAGFVLSALHQLDSCFEKLFESEKLYGSGTTIGNAKLSNINLASPLYLIN